MLPFLKKNKEVGLSGIIVKHRDPDEDAPQDEPNSGLKAAAQDILDAIKADDVSRLSDALRAAFQIIDAMPHEEGPHIEEQD